jgi:hypothetical protein
MLKCAQLNISPSTLYTQFANVNCLKKYIYISVSSHIFNTFSLSKNQKIIVQIALQGMTNAPLPHFENVQEVVAPATKNKPKDPANDNFNSGSGI